MMRTLTVLLACVAINAVADDGAKLYQNYCTQCHGIEGKGDGINAPHMSVVPRDHTDAAEMGKRSDADLKQVISEGGSSMNQSILMPAWGDLLDDDEIHALLRHLRTLCCES